MDKIFISYSQHDLDAVKRIHSALDAVFHDDGVFYDAHIGLGENWWDNILQRIAVCDVFVYALSTVSMQSQACQAELLEALRLRKHLVLIAVEPNFRPPPTPFTSMLSKINWAKMPNGEGDSGPVIVNISKFLYGRQGQNINLNDVMGHNVAIGGNVYNIQYIVQQDRSIPPPEVIQQSIEEQNTTNSVSRLYKWDALQLLWWLLTTPEKIQKHDQVFGKRAKWEAKFWLIHIFTWFPILISALALFIRFDLRMNGMCQGF